MPSRQTALIPARHESNMRRVYVPERPRMTADEYLIKAMSTERTPIFIKIDPEGTFAAAMKNRKVSRLVHGMIGMCTEVGELQDMIKKHLIYGKAFDATNVLEECGDVLWYIALTLSACDFTFQQAMEANIKKLAARYTKGFTKKAALKRNLGKERRILEASGKKSRKR